MVRTPTRILLPSLAGALALLALAGCSAVGGVASVASTAVGLAGTAVSTTADIVTAPLP